MLNDVAAIDADERQATRFEGRLPCRLDADGAAWVCWLRDLSADGAAVEPAMPALLGREVTLDSDSFPFDRQLVGRVVNVAERRTCIAFDLAPETKTALRTFIDDNS